MRPAATSGCKNTIAPLAANSQLPQENEQPGFIHKETTMVTKKKYWTGTRKAPEQDRFFIEALDPDLWSRGDSEDWDTLWQTGMPPNHVFSKCKPDATINHIPGNNALTVKSMLYETLVHMKANAPAGELQDQLSFFPRAYLMPEDYHELQSQAVALPECNWIAKPRRLSRGRGIEVLSDAGAAPLGKDWLIQEYLGKPDILFDRKYVIRCYVLIASIAPLRVYFYKDGSVKSASEPYSDDVSNLFAHLTNPDINAQNAAADAAVVFKSFDEYRALMRERNKDADPILRALREIGIMTAIAALPQMRARVKATGADPRRCYELIGMDCMVDANLKPWLLECNLSASLEVCCEPDSGGRYEERMKRNLAKDMVAALDLNNPTASAPSLDDDHAMIAAITHEQRRAGRFDLVYPAQDAFAYLPLFGAPPHHDWVLASAFAQDQKPQLGLRSNDVREVVENDTLHLYSARNGKTYTPEPGPAFIWLNAVAGAEPDTVISALSDASQADQSASTQRALSAQVRSALTDWLDQGLLTSASASAENRKTVTPSASDISEHYIQWGDEIIAVCFSERLFGPRLAALLNPLRTARRDTSETITILKSKIGYAIVGDQHLLRSGLRASDISDALASVLLDRLCDDHDAILMRSAFVEHKGNAFLIANTRLNAWDAPALALAEGAENSLLGCVQKLGAPGTATPISIAPRIAATDRGEAMALSGRDMAKIDKTQMDTWPGCRHGHHLALDAIAPTESATPITAILFPKRTTSVSARAPKKRITGKDRVDAINALYRPCRTVKYPPIEYLLWAENIPAWAVPFDQLTDLAGLLEQLSN